MFESLQVLRYALDEGRLMFRSREALERHQDHLLREHLRWVAVHSPATAQRFRDAGLPLSHFRELPPIAKAEMMASFDNLNTAGVRLQDVLRVARSAEESRDFSPALRGRYGTVSVGLSTGTSGRQGVFITSAAERRRWAGVVLRWLLPDWPLGLLRPRPHRVAFILRADNNLYRSVRSGRVQFHFFDLLRPLPELAAELTACSPTLLAGPPSVLRALLEAGAQAAPERVISVAEVLEPDDEQALQEGFGPVVQVYQATEGLLALPCPHGKLHLNEAHVYFDFETLDGGYVRPVITDLRRRTQPMIRHRLNDVLLLGECTCGLASRRVLRIAGRQDDALLFPAPGGTVTVWPDFLRSALAGLAQLREYRLTQVGPSALELELLPLNAELAQQAEQAVRRTLTKHGVHDVQLRTRPLSEQHAGRKQRRVTRLPDAPTRSV